MLKFEDLPPLEEDCKHCGGTGEKSKSVYCSNCHGRKTALTEFGLAIISLMKNYMPWESDIDNVRMDVRDLQREQERRHYY